MASSTLVPYVNNSTTQSFSLVSTSSAGAKWMVTGRAIGVPYTIEVIRKLSPSTSTTNDHIQLRIARTEQNATSAKLATMQLLLDISIPKDASVITATEQKKLLSILASLFNESTAMEATNVAITSLIEGRDI